MSAVVERAGAVQSVHRRPTEKRRGEIGMWLFIGTEAMLFALLFFAYFYLGASKPQWPLEEDPPYTLALVLLAILAISSGVAEWAKRGVAKDQTGRLKIGLGLTLLLGAAFIVVQIFEYRAHLPRLRPDDNAYGSIFYTITSVHFAHVLMGLGLLLFVFARALAGHFSAQRHVAVKNATVYWHFVDLVWIFVVAVIYLSPHFYAPPP
jgi:heme/copper-type cytochrome/quinol oxidase subunit 3